jgi:hypothetical protein
VWHIKSIGFDRRRHKEIVDLALATAVTHGSGNTVWVRICDYFASPDNERMRGNICAKLSRVAHVRLLIYQPRRM